MKILGPWFGLIVLYTVATHVQAVTAALGGVGIALQRIGDPAVPLIGDGSGSTPTGVNVVPLQTKR